MANLPEPTDLQAFLDLEDRRQSFGIAPARLMARAWK
jgi:hypothetical protein